MRKKLLACGLAVIFALGFGACGNAGPSGAAASGQTAQEAESVQSAQEAESGEESVQSAQPTVPDTEETEEPATEDIGIVSGAESQEAEQGSGEEPAPIQGQRVKAVLERLDAQPGIHLRYEAYISMLDTTSRMDVHAKDGVYYAAATAEIAGNESTSVTFCKDGKVYNLNPANKTGLFVIEYPEESLANIIQMDTLYSILNRCAQETEYTEGTEEVNGVPLYAEIYPSTSEYVPETTFCFDGADLVFVRQGEIKSGDFELGESTFTVLAVDDAVDESLFDISDYEITELSTEE